MSLPSTSLSKIKMNSRSMDLEEKRAKERRKAILLLVNDFCYREGYVKTAQNILDESKMRKNEYILAENVDLEIVFSGYAEYFFMKFGKYPRYFRKNPNPPPKKKYGSRAARLAKRNAAYRTSKSARGAAPGGRSKGGGGTKGKRTKVDIKEKESATKRSGTGDKGPGDKQEENPIFMNVKSLGGGSSNKSRGKARAKGGGGKPKKGAGQQPQQELSNNDTSTGKEQNEKNVDFLPPGDSLPLRNIVQKTRGGGNLRGAGLFSGMEDILHSTIITERPNVKWDDVAGLEQAKDTLQEAVVLPIKFPELFQGNRHPWKGVLLYGPPGTGKSHLAKAVASEANSTFFSVSAATLVSKWVGESEKLVKTLFDLAREHKPSIIFIDEVDSLCSARGSSSTNTNSTAMARMKTQFLIEMDGVVSDTHNEGILVLAATNLPYNLDLAVRRRFERRIYIPMPDTPARVQMLKLFVGDVHTTLENEQFDELAEMTELFSGADLNIFVRNAIMEPIRRCRIAKYFKRIDCEEKGILFMPCGSKSEKGAVEMTIKDVPPGRLRAPAVEYADFVNALKGVKPSVGKGELKRYEEFTREFGIEGSVQS